ncbi:hypothetical protein ACFLZ5_10020 [Thermodesulfobacteriota bacterium]
MKYSLFFLLTILLAAFFLVPRHINAFNFGDALRKVTPPIKTPSFGIKGITENEPAITTSLEDAVTDLPILDDFNPQSFVALQDQKNGQNNEVLLQPGYYETILRSYCLHAGKHGPGKGEGYLYAPLKGPLAPIISNILKRSGHHPEVIQKDIQVLIWGVLARSKISKMPENIRWAATKLLTSKEINKLNGGALGMIPEELLHKAFSHLPPEVRQVLEAEARIRNLLSRAQVSYDEIERIAVPFGDSPVDEEGRNIPRGRWSYHPDDYFVRYYPSGYRKTKIQIAVPKAIQIDRDETGRIILVADSDGNAIVLEYNDNVEPLIVPGLPDLVGYAFQMIRFIRPDPETGKISTAEWHNTGWTFVVNSIAHAQAIDNKYLNPFAPIMFASLEFDNNLIPNQSMSDVSTLMASGPGNGNEYQDIIDRANKAGEKFEAMKKFYEGSQEPSGKVFEKMASSKYLEDSLEAAGSVGNPKKQSEWVRDHTKLVREGWLYSICRLAGGCEEDEASKGKQYLKPFKPGEPRKKRPSSSGPRKLRQFRPSKSAVQPGNSSGQRLGLSR